MEGRKKKRQEEEASAMHAESEHWQARAQQLTTSNKL